MPHYGSQEEFLRPSRRLVGVLIVGLLAKLARDRVIAESSEETIACPRFVAVASGVKG
jgi:hypothetical protein